MARYYIYFHRRPDKDEVFYVGRGMMYAKTAYPRRAYEIARRNKQWQSIVRRNGGKFIVEIVEWFDSLPEVLAAEKRHISLLGKKFDATGPLINITDGGDGSLGLKHSAETRQKLSEYWSGNKARLDFLRSEQFKAKRREKMRGRPSPSLGKKASAAAREAMSRSRSGGKNYRAKAVINTETGDTYDCVNAAAIATGIGKWSLYKSLSGERANHTPMRYV